jgi:hypothetical protein
MLRGGSGERGGEDQYEGRNQRRRSDQEVAADD